MTALHIAGQPLGDQPALCGTLVALFSAAPATCHLCSAFAFGTLHAVATGVVLLRQLGVEEQVLSRAWERAVVAAATLDLQAAAEGRAAAEVHDLRRSLLFDCYHWLRPLLPGVWIRGQQGRSRPGCCTMQRRYWRRHGPAGPGAATVLMGPAGPQPPT